MTTVSELRQAVSVIARRLGIQAELHTTRPGDGATRYSFRVRRGSGWEDHAIGVGKREAAAWLAGADKVLDLADRTQRTNPKRGAVPVHAHRRRRPRLHRNPAGAERQFIRDVADQLRSIAQEVPRGEELDVRLQVIDAELTEDGALEEIPEWNVWTGDASYDTDHRGDWGAGTITHRMSLAELTELARSLVDEALDAAAS